MEHIYLNCTNNSYCEITKSEIEMHERIHFILILCFSLLGVILNSISAFIFTFSKNSSTKFLKFLKFYSFISLAISLNDFMFSITRISSKNDIYVYEQKEYLKKIACLFLNII